MEKPPLAEAPGVDTKERRVALIVAALPFLAWVIAIDVTSPPSETEYVRTFYGVFAVIVGLLLVFQSKLGMVSHVMNIGGLICALFISWLPHYDAVNEPRDIEGFMMWVVLLVPLLVFFYWGYIVLVSVVRGYRNQSDRS